MRIPFITSRSEQHYRRKGGGGKGGGGKGGGSTGKGGSGSGSSSGSSGKGSSSGSKGSSGSTGKSSSVPVSGATGGRTSAASYGGGGGKSTTIPSGQLFSGRTSGGATRSQVYGTSAYGSGYPGISGLGVANRGFPYVFWPVVFGVGLGYGAEYLHDNEYGEPNNSSRPGGPMAEATFTSSTSNSTFHVLSDNTTVSALISAVSDNCTLGMSSTTPSPYNGSAGEPVPEQGVQYYRASSVLLTLDGYNDTSVLGGNSSATPVPLPGWVDSTLLDCLNATIGEAVPLFSGADARWQPPSVGLVGLAFVFYCLSSLVF
ncbi:hypothetical protein B0H21DRAFT_701378 [Amylocystis lapponica]|nr:hypothetical protein B0H21DRAFT_701378 [Amylocystis lapponica]